MSFACTLCNCKLLDVKKYNDHQALHRNLPNARFLCVYKNCRQGFNRYINFKMHVFRSHKVTTSQTSETSCSFACSVTNCSFKSIKLKELSSHILVHIRSGTNVKCPFSSCVDSSKDYNTTSQMKSHIYRVHHFRDNFSHNNEEFLGNDAAPIDDIPNHESQLDIAEDIMEPNKDTCHDSSEDIYLKMLASMYLTLQTKHFLTDAALQTIIDGFLDINELTFTAVAAKFSELGLTAPPNFTVNDNLLLNFHNTSNGPLRTPYARKEFYKKHFSYIDPICIHLHNTNQDEKAPKMYYVPVLETIKMLMSNSHVREWSHHDRGNSSGPNVLQDITDGEVYRNNVFFRNNKDALRIILYQDAFEICNPLGSSRKTYKVVGIYLVLGNIPQFHRSRVDNIQLVALCLESDLKKYAFPKVFESIIRDIKSLESEGLRIDEIAPNVKGSVMAVLGDNLGSHQIGGYGENFSTQQYFCRYCHITKDEFQNQGKLWASTLRTKDSYQFDVDLCDILPAGESSRGVKGDSVLNQLNYFHVANPGLPPCIAHDLYEGVVQYDLMLMVNRLVAENFFSLDFLNSKLQRIRFCTESKHEKIPIIKKTDKLPGSATENLRILQIIPFAVYDVVDTSHPVWKMLLILRKICNLVMCFKITVDQIACLRSLLIEYIELRVELFPHVNLRPKHHNILHYPNLLLKFGPLRPLWTLRFESKHRYFKNVIKHSQNYKNVLHSFSVKHQLLQALLHSQNSTFSDYVVSGSVRVYKSNDFPQQVSSVVENVCTFEEPFITEKVTFRGIEYKSGMFVCYGMNENGHYCICRIMYILLNRAYKDINFVGKKIEIIEHSDIGLFVIIKQFDDIELTCINYVSLTPIEPLQHFVTEKKTDFFNFKSAPCIDI